jgi:hypothetical protein
MRKNIALGVLVLGFLCLAAGFIVVATRTSFGAFRDSARHVTLTGDDGGSGKPFSCSPMGDEGGPGKPFCNCTF